MKAIETSYKGYRFRSRLEARWAVFFDTLGVKWEYEPEGYELPSGRYLPDFMFHSRIDGERCVHFIEIKGPEPRRIDITLADELAKHLDCCGLIVQGDPLRYTAWRFFPKLEPKQAIGDLAFLQFQAWVYSGFLIKPTVSEMLTAANAARAARFEFGERGIPRGYIDEFERIGEGFA